MLKKLVAWLSGIGTKILDFLAPILKTETGKALNALLPIALGIVAGLVRKDGLSGVQKRDMAVEQLRAEAVRLGVSTSVSVLNTVVELAYQRFQADKATTRN